ncbi:MAG: hypothetical protein RMJ35_03910 [Phycisphaerales bacterium]|nr:hypothetical protein [Phycisphaerales bacterium]
MSARRIRAARMDLDGFLAIQKGRSTDKTSRLTGLLLEPFSQLDLGDNDLVIDYAPSQTPAASVRQLLALGYNKGSWTGLGLASSAAAATPATALGWAEASELYSTFPAVFSGQTVDETAILIGFVPTGDANLDGITDLADFARLGSTFNLPADWSRGDFNYDGTADLADFAQLAANFNQSLPLGRDAGFDPRATIPEPLTAPAALLLLARRRRSRPQRTCVARVDDITAG